MLLIQVLGGTMLNFVRCPIQLTRYFPGTHEGVGCWVRCRHCSGNYKARGVSGEKYEAQIVIFCILVTVERILLDFLESGKPLRKAESH